MSRSSVFSEDDVSSALQDVLDLTQRYKSGTRRPIKSRADKRHDQKVEELKKKLELSKKNVVRHLIKTRQLEHSLQQQEITADAVKHLITLPFNQSGRRNAHSKWLDHSTLQLIDAVARFPENTSFHLQHALNTYNDNKLIDELSTFPLAQVHTLNKELYVTIVWVASGKRIAYHEAATQYDTSEQHMKRLHLTTKEEQWIVLQRILRSALQLRHLFFALYPRPIR